MVGLGQARHHSAVGRLLLGLGLADLMRVEVQPVLLVEDRCPGEIATDRLVEVLQAGLIDRKEHQRVLEESRRIAAALQDGCGRRLRLVAGVFAVGIVDPQHDEPRVHVVGHVCARLRHRVDAAKVARSAQVSAQPLLDLGGDRVGIALELLGPILGELGDGRLRRVPVARAVLVEVGRRRAQTPQRVAEHRRLTRPA